MNTKKKRHRTDLDDFRKIITEEKKSSTYPVMAKKYKVNQYYLSKIINDENYKPPNSICKILDVRKTKTKRRFQIELPVDIPEEQKEEIRSLKKELRLEAIMNYIKGS